MHTGLCNIKHTHSTCLLGNRLIVWFCQPGGRGMDVDVDVELDKWTQGAMDSWSAGQIESRAAAATAAAG